ncbi:MAG: short-chain dehydrogenase [Acidimicrobiaceae bacterium]|jgi:NAD(P)-dependent dehydrogenase (short-subunit alcohol dehydrogenase family)|nr:short-chain dehydrogenase [Acidimicrobiaceae bacterium]|tara:strand:+ start:3896 stop:4738 length:843 start_codon:yes stop_codon:yes gene_type:complete
MSNSELKGKVAVVTGSSRGIGRGIAIGLGERGATVYITGRSKGNGALTIEETAEMVNQAGGIGMPVGVDLGDDKQIEALYEEIASKHGRLDIHVNNAFKIPDPPVWGGKFWEHPVQIWDDQVGIGLRAAYVASVHATKLMMTQRDSLKLIVNISSSGSERYALSASYGIAKMGTDRLTRDFAVEGKDDGLCVIGLWPSQVLTEFILESIEKGDITLDEENSETPLYTGRVIARLATDQARFERNGQVLTTAELALHYDIKDERGKQPKGKRNPSLFREKI